MAQPPKAAVESRRSSARLSLRIAASPDTIAEFCDCWHVAESSLSGAVLREDFVRDSDIDVLVGFEPDGMPGIRFAGMASELSRLLGRAVDVVTRPAAERSPNYIRRRGIRESAQVIHVAR